MSVDVEKNYGTWNSQKMQKGKVSEESVILYMIVWHITYNIASLLQTKDLKVGQ